MAHDPVLPGLQGREKQRDRDREPGDGHHPGRWRQAAPRAQGEQEPHAGRRGHRHRLINARTENGGGGQRGDHEPPALPVGAAQPVRAQQQADHRRDVLRAPDEVVEHVVDPPRKRRPAVEHDDHPVLADHAGGDREDVPAADDARAHDREQRAGVGCEETPGDQEDEGDEQAGHEGGGESEGGRERDAVAGDPPGRDRKQVVVMIVVIGSIRLVGEERVVQRERVLGERPEHGVVLDVVAGRREGDAVEGGGQPVKEKHERAHISEESEQPESDRAGGDRGRRIAGPAPCTQEDQHEIQPDDRREHGQPAVGPHPQRTEVQGNEQDGCPEGGRQPGRHRIERGQQADDRASGQPQDQGGAREEG